MSYFRVKRLIDIVLSLVAILLLTPFLLIIALIIKLESKGAVIFKQKRIGKDKQYFYIYKFRTMRIDTPGDTPTHLLQNPDKYITKCGRILRKLSLDELPQLFNIIKGEMSIVGPRPALWNQTDLIEERDKYGANAIRPGLTGWAQVNGRDELPIEVKAKYDGEYVDRLSVWFDLRIMFMTIYSVLVARGVKEGTSVDSKPGTLNNTHKL
jgi:O-antigen biosynthesis protein WbqP